MYGQWTTQTTNVFVNFFQSVLAYLPRVLFATLIVLLGVLIGKLAKAAIVKLLKLIRLKPYTDAVGLNKVFTQKVEFADLIGDLVGWTIIIVSLLPALEILNMPKVYDLVYGIVAYIPRVIVAVVIIIVGVIIADLVSRLVESTAQTIGSKTAAIAADLARWTIVIMAVISAINQLGINTMVVNQVITGMIALIAIAGGIAFGLGGQDTAKEMLEGLKKNVGK